MNPILESQQLLGRRAFLGAGAHGIGLMALGSLLFPDLSQGAVTSESAKGLPGLPHFAPKAKRVLCLFQSEGVSHVDLFDYKPTLVEYHGQEIPPSVKGTQRLGAECGTALVEAVLVILKQLVERLAALRVAGHALEAHVELLLERADAPPHVRAVRRAERRQV